MKCLQSKGTIGLVCFVLGATSVGVIQKIITPQQKRLSLPVAQTDFGQDRLLDWFFNDDLFDRSHGQFEEMRRMRERMNKQFGEDSGGGGFFDSWYQKKFGGGSPGEIRKREDDKFVYYDISLDGLDKAKLNVKVADGQIIISGRHEKKFDEGGAGTYFSSSFHRSFPVPHDVDGIHVQMEQNKDKLVVKFPKMNA